MQNGREGKAISVVAWDSAGVMENWKHLQKELQKITLFS